jgi:hypothetical protein
MFHQCSEAGGSDDSDPWWILERRDLSDVACKPTRGSSAKIRVRDQIAGVQSGYNLAKMFPAMVSRNQDCHPREAFTPGADTGFMRRTIIIDDGGKCFPRRQKPGC